MIAVPFALLVEINVVVTTVDEVVTSGMGMYGNPKGVV